MCFTMFSRFLQEISKCVFTFLCQQLYPIKCSESRFITDKCICRDKKLFVFRFVLRGTYFYRRL